MATTDTNMNFWVRWKRGFSAMWRAYIVLLVAYACLYLPAWIGGAALDNTPQPWQEVLGVIFIVVLFATVLIFLPITVSRLQMDPTSIKEELASELEPKIDAVATQLGVEWENHYIAHVSELIRNDKFTEARRYYHDHSGANWDEVDQALSNWRVAVVTEKLAILQNKLGEVPASTNPQTA